MSKDKFPLDMSLEERQKKFLKMSDEDIDYSDIPPFDDEFFKNAKLVKRSPKTEEISIQVDTEILKWFRNHAQERGYQTLINDVLRTYVNRKKSGKVCSWVGKSLVSIFDQVTILN